MRVTNVEYGVSVLVDWAKSRLGDNSNRNDCVVCLERAMKDCFFFGKTVAVRESIKDSKTNRVYAYTDFSLYNFFPPVLGRCAESRTFDIAEKVSVVFLGEGIPYQLAVEGFFEEGPKRPVLMRK